MLVTASMHCIYKIVLTAMHGLLRFLNVAILSDLSFRGNGIPESASCRVNGSCFIALEVSL